MRGDSEQPDPVSAAIGARLRSLRRGRGMTQGGLASAAGFDQPFISKVERGEQNLELRSMARLARALGCSLEELVAGVEL